MTDLDRIGNVISSRLEGIVPPKFFCAARALIPHLMVKESDVNSIEASGREKMLSTCFALGISVVPSMVEAYLNSQLKLTTLPSGIDYALKHPNTSLQHFLDDSVSSDLRRKYADPLLRGFGQGHYDIVDDDTLLELVGTASKLITQSASVIYHLYVQSHVEMVSMLLKKYDMKSVDENGLNVLHMSARDGNQRALIFFVEKGGEVNDVDTKGWSPLSYAVHGGHLSVVSFLLSTNARTDLIDLSGNSLLHLACMNGSLDVLQLLLRSVAENDGLEKEMKHAYNNDGLNCLHISAKYGHWRIVIWCLENGFDGSELDLQGMSPLHHAAAADSSLSIKALHTFSTPYPKVSLTLESPLHIAVRNRRVDVLSKLVELYDLKSEWYSAFKLALSLGFSEVVAELLKKDAKGMMTSSSSDHPLFTAVNMKNELLVRVLLRHSRYINNKLLVNSFLTAFNFKGMEILNDLSRVLGMRLFSMNAMAPIFHLLINNQASIVEILSSGDCAQLLGLVLDCEIKVENALTKEKKTIFGCAVERGHVNMLKVLHSRGLINSMDLNASLIKLSTFGHVSCIDFLLKHGAEVNTPDTDGKTSLIVASEKGYTDCFDLLLKAGANVNASSSTRMTSLMYASQKGHSTCFDLLLEASADVNASANDGMTSLMYASRNGRSRFVDLLLKAGADVNASRSDRMTSLILASFSGHSTCVDLLLKAGANVNATDNYRRSALHYAVQHNQLASAESLLKGGADVSLRDSNNYSVLQMVSGHNAGEMIALLRKYGAQ